MLQIPTLYFNYQELLLDLDILGRILSTSISESDLKDSLFDEYRLSHPLPTLEDKRYELSDLVSSDYHISYANDIELDDDCELIDLYTDNSSPFIDVDYNVIVPDEVKNICGYNDRVTDSMREEIIERYFNSGIEDYSGVSSEVEEVFNTIDSKASVYKDEDDYTSEESESEDEYDSEYEDEYDSEYEDEYDSEENEGYGSEDEDEYDSEYEDGYDSEDEDDYDSEYEDEYDSEENEGYGSEDDYSDETDLDNSEDESESDDEYDSEDEDDYSSDDYEDEDEYDLGDEDDYDSDTSDVDYSDETDLDDYAPEENEGYDSEDEDDYDFENEDDYDSEDGDYDSEDDYGSESEDDYESEVGDSYEDEGENEDAVENPVDGHNINNESVSSPQKDEDFDGFSDLVFSVPTPVEVERRNVKNTEVQQPSVVQEKVDRESEPRDLREFVRKHPRCEISEALKYFSRKEIEKYLLMGKIFKKGSKLHI